ncbi:hypothetical protein GTV32_11760 [Gordonia sp. SID5947]|nr:hypothetical protein [Gordonia sp. SID5947]
MIGRSVDDDPDNRKWEIMASSRVASSQGTDYSPVRVHVWRVLSMVAALVAVVVSLLVIVTSAA